MTAEKDNGVSVEQGLKKANPFEKVGIWASYRLLQYLESLDVAPAKPVSNYTRQLENIAMGIIIAGGVLLIGSMTVDNIRRTQAPYTIGVGPEQTRPEPYVFLDKGSIATFRYGAIINNVEGLRVQVFPHKLEAILEETNLIPPVGTIFITEITNNANIGDGSNLTLQAQNKYEQEQGPIAYIGYATPLNYQEMIGRSFPEGKPTLATPSLHIQMGFQWLKRLKGLIGRLRTDQQNSDPDPNLTQQESLVAGRGLPFWIVSAP